MHIRKFKADLMEQPLFVDHSASLKKDEIVFEV